MAGKGLVGMGLADVLSGLRPKARGPWGRAGLGLLLMLVLVAGRLDPAAGVPANWTAAAAPAAAEVGW